MRAAVTAWHDRRKESVALAPCRNLHAGGKAKLVQDVVDMCLHGLSRNHQLVRDLSIVEALRDQRRDLHLPTRKCVLNLDRAP